MKNKLQNFFLNSEKRYSKLELFSNWWLFVGMPIIFIFWLTINAIAGQELKNYDFSTIFQNVNWVGKILMNIMMILALITMFAILYKFFKFWNRWTAKRNPWLEKQN